TLTLSLPGDTGAAIDDLYFDRVEIQYKRRLAVGADDLFFRIESPAPRTIELQANPGSDREIIDVTDPYNVVWLDGVSKQAGQTSQVLRFSHAGQTPASFYVFGREHVRKPRSISYWQPEGLRHSSNQADHLILAPREFVPALQVLRNHRQVQGLKSRIVAFEEIFNEFGHGFPTPEAIRAFLTWAYHGWSSPRPRYVLLVGDGTVDYKDHYKTGKKGKAPVHLTRTSLRGITPDDHWYACVDGDDPVADPMIGRIPGENPDQVAAIVSKIVHFEQSGGKANPLLTAVADKEKVSEETSDKLMALAPPYFTVEKAYYRQLKAQTRPLVLDSLKRGPAVASYVGHGDLIRWAEESILRSADVSEIGNSPESLSFFVALNCLNGYFGYPYYYCLGEELVNAPAAAVACVAPSGGTFPDEHEIFGLELFSAIFQDRLLTLGDALAQAKVASYAKGVFSETILQYTLFGDPAAKLKDW
ncbi:MAG TPA: C25 family cysteine peptidase, partial [Acidobacteriota bacterium]|nr:C25 family cysteine peptidase [Acidobacteriota bacterium]